MYPASFEYVRAENLEHALALLTHHGTDARVLAGGQSLLPLMKQRAIAPKVTVDISRLYGLRDIEDHDDILAMGALVRHADIGGRDLRGRLALLADTASVIGDVQVRNLGTVTGSIAHADPVGDWAPALIALRASLSVRSLRGERSIPVTDLISDAFTNTLLPDEIITAVQVPRSTGVGGSAYLKLGRRIGDFGIASVAASLGFDDDGSCIEAQIAVGGVTPTPLIAEATEAFLIGKSLSVATVGEAAALAQSAIDPMDDARASAEYRYAMTPVLISRALGIIGRRANGEVCPAGYV